MMIMDERHPEDCIHCRARALAMTAEQAQLVKEAIAAGAAIGWKQRGYLPRTPTDQQIQHMMAGGIVAWSVMFGTLIPESDEVRTHRHREH